MKIIIISNAYKGNLKSLEVADNIERGILRVIDADIVKLPVADGGDGTLDTLLSALGGERMYTTARDPLGREIEAPFGILSNGKGVVEMALVSGLSLIKHNERDIMKASSYGTGQIIKALLDRGVKEIIIGIGGSATNDGGTGAAEALGAVFTDKDGNTLNTNGGNLTKISGIDLSGMDARLKDCEITVACDVTNPLYGREGAAYVFAPQKGANAEQVEELDKGLRTLSKVIANEIGIDYSDVKGAGAAGGMGFGLISMIKAKLLSGIDTMLNAVDYDKHLLGADLVFTGEGRMDNQSAYGKVPAGVAARAKERGIPVVAIVGSVGEDIDELYKIGINAIVPTVEAPCTLQYAISHAGEQIANAAERVLRIMGMVK